MEQIKNLAAASKIGSGEQTVTGSNNVTADDISNLWEAMSMFYGHAWANSYGDADNGVWLAGLCDVSPEGILRGINACRVTGKTWPPSLPEFRKMCLPPI